MDDEEDVTAQLLRLAGAPPDPSAARTARVRDAVYREWLVARRRRTMRRMGIALVGVAASVWLAVWVARSPTATQRPAVAAARTVRLQGRPLIARHASGSSGPAALALSDAIHVDDVVETDGESRTSLQTADGASVRLDQLSRVRFQSSTVLEVLAGGVYVASTEGAPGLEVRTPLGALRDVGTQFEVRVTPLSLRVRVRTGIVEIRREAKVTTAAAGTEAMVTTEGIAIRQVAAFGSDWSWMTEIAPACAIEGRPLRAFLQYLAVEEGWTLRYADATVTETASRTILHGSVAGLKAEDALMVVLATSGLDYRLRAGELLISRAPSAR
jgi:ferric-dicitrate binding protein FerR (iron transport regulator)